MNTKESNNLKNTRELTIRLDDLRPKENVVGGKRKVVFGIIRTISRKNK